MRIGEVNHKTARCGNIVTMYRSEVGMCSFLSFEPKTAAWMEQKRPRCTNGESDEQGRE